MASSRTTTVTSASESLSELARRRHAARELGLPLTTPWAEIEAHAAASNLSAALAVRARSSFVHDVLAGVARLRASEVVPVDAIVVGDPPIARRTGAVLELTLTLSPRTKKNHGRGVARESAAYVRFRNQVKALVTPWHTRLGLPMPEIGYNCAAHFVVDTEQADTVGLMQALADALQDAQVLTNDRLIQTWDGTYQEFAPLHPQITLRLAPRSLAGLRFP